MHVMERCSHGTALCTSLIKGMKLTPDLLTSIAIVLLAVITAGRTFVICSSLRSSWGQAGSYAQSVFLQHAHGEDKRGLDEGRFEQFRNQYSSLLASKCED